MMSGKRKPSSPPHSVSSDEEDVGRTADKHDTSDTGYESVGSPGSVSTISVCSEQALEELSSLPACSPASSAGSSTGLWPGARETTGARPKTQSKKKKNPRQVNEEFENKEEPAPTTPKNRFKRVDPLCADLPAEPLPMKLRALPQSFWQQPNSSSTSPSGSCLPPLVTTSKDSQDVNDVRPITPPEQRGQRTEGRVTVGNTELLFSLFDGVDQALDRRKVTVVKRGRPKKTAASLPRVSQDDDPYISSTASDSILPLLPDRSSVPSTPASIRNTQVLSVLQLPGGCDRESICLPSLSVEHNHSNILSQLVMKL